MPQHLISRNKEKSFPTDLAVPTPAGTAPGRAPLATPPQLLSIAYTATLRMDVPRPCHPALAPLLLAAGNQSCTQYLFPMQTHGRFMQQSTTVFCVSFSLCFLKVHYIQSAFLIAPEYRVDIFMEVFILTPRHVSSPAAARSEPGTAYGCEDCFASLASLSLQQRWILSTALPSSRSLPDVLCNSLHSTHFHHLGQGRSSRHLWRGVLSLLPRTGI